MRFLLSTNRIQLPFAVCVLIALTFMLPSSFASQGDSPNQDSVLAITRYKMKPDANGDLQPTTEIRKISYIGQGATVNLTLKDGRKITQGYIDKIGNQSIFVAGEMISLASIERIELGETKQRRMSKIFGAIVLVIGLACAGLIIGAVIANPDFFDTDLLALLLFWIPGFLWVNGLLRKFPSFRLDLYPYSLSIVPRSGTPERVRKRLAKRFRFYHNRIRKD